MRIVFFGSGEFGLPTLEALRAHHDVALVVSQPDRPAGRSRQLTPTPIAQWAIAQNLPLIRPEKVNYEAVMQQIRDANADAHVVIAFGQKIGREIIEAPRLGRAATVNLHASLLPKYRGAAPIHWAILSGEKSTGNTVFSLVEKMDAGEILGQQSTPIGPLETTGELHDRLAKLGPELVLNVLAELESGTAKPLVQDESAVTIARKLSRADGEVDFGGSAEEIRRRVHGLTPWPGVTVWWSQTPGEARQALMLRRVEAMAKSPRGGAPGEMIAEGVVATRDGAVRLIEVQPPGKRTMKWEEFARGSGPKIGAGFYSAEK